MPNTEIPPRLRTAAGMTKLCVTLGYKSEPIITMLKTKYNLTDSDARDLLAAVKENTLSVDGL